MCGAPDAHHLTHGGHANRALLHNLLGLTHDLTHDSFFFFFVCLVPYLVPLLYFQNVVYKYPDFWVCPYAQYGCDPSVPQEECVDSAWVTEGGAPDAIFYPRERLDQEDERATEQRKIDAFPAFTDEYGEEDPEIQVRRSNPSLPSFQSRKHVYYCSVGEELVPSKTCCATLESAVAMMSARRTSSS